MKTNANFKFKESFELARIEGFEYELVCLLLSECQRCFEERGFSLHEHSYLQFAMIKKKDFGNGQFVKTYVDIQYNSGTLIFSVQTHQEEAVRTDLDDSSDDNDMFRDSYDLYNENASAEDFVRKVMERLEASYSETIEKLKNSVSDYEMIRRAIIHE